MNLTGCSRLQTRVEAGTWYRAIQPHFMTTALATSHTSTVSSRFNPGPLGSLPFEVLYLAENHQVALFEVQALLGSPWVPGGVVPHPRRAWTLLNINVNLNSIVDLTDPSSQTVLSTTAQELTGDWRGYQLRGSSTSVQAPTGVAPTQELGAEIFKLGYVQGFRTLSAKLPDHSILVVFPQRLGSGPGTRIEFWNPVSRQVESVP